MFAKSYRESDDNLILGGLEIKIEISKMKTFLNLSHSLLNMFLIDKDKNGGLCVWGT